MAKKNSGGKQRREHYRIKYPVTDRPIFQAYGVSFFVLDLSESGFRLEENPNAVLGPKSKLEGVILFKDGAREKVTSVVIRIIEGQVIAKFSNSIPLSRIMLEQRRLIAANGRL